MSALVFIALVFAISNGYAMLFRNVYPTISFNSTESADAGNPLILTPFINNGSEALGRNLSRVSFTEDMNIESYAGFFTVDEAYESNLYFWYFPAFSKNKKAPVILWLQGGPGASSLYGLFTELGPLKAEKEGFLLRKYNWALNYHLIFIDNPVGTGFSFTRNDNGYCNDEKCVGKNLFSAMTQFFLLFPDLQDNEFYIAGESYAGKYIPSLAIQIHQSTLPNVKINLKGLLMGNAYCDPVNQMDYGKYLYQHGLVGFNQATVFENMQNKIKEAINNEDWVTADLLMDKLIDGEIGNFSYFKSFTGFEYYYNFLQTNDDEDMSALKDLLSNDKIRKSIHVGGLPFNSGSQVQLHLAKDILKSVAPYITELLSHYRVMLYNGQLDIIVAYPLTENFIRNLDFSSASEYKNATRHIWRADDDIAGYFKVAGNLTEVIVRNSGHMVPRDQPKWALDLVNRFIKNKFRN